MRLTHLDISIARDALRDGSIAEADGLLCGVLGWTKDPGRPGGATWRQGEFALTVHVADLVLIPGQEDHIGFVVGLDEIRSLGRACSELSVHARNVETLYLTNGVPDRVETPTGTFHTFFVRCALPLWLQFEHFAEAT